MSTRVPHLGVEDEDGFQALLREHPRCLVLFRGESCPYSTSFVPTFEARAAAAPDWTFLVRGIEHGGEGPHGERHRIEVTPTIVAYRDGRPASRLEGRLLVGLTGGRLDGWIRTLDA